MKNILKKRKPIEVGVSYERACEIALNQEPLDVMLQKVADEYNSYMSLDEMMMSKDLVTLKNTDSLIDGHTLYLRSNKPFSEYSKREQEEIVNTLSIMHGKKLRKRKDKITRCVLYFPRNLEDISNESVKDWETRWFWRAADSRMTDGTVGVSLPIASALLATLVFPEYASEISWGGTGVAIVGASAFRTKKTRSIRDIAVSEKVIDLY